MAQDPNPDMLSTDIVQEIIRKALEIAPPEPALVKMEAPGIFGDFADADTKFRKEILAELT